MGQIIYPKRDYATTGKIAYPSREIDLTKDLIAFYNLDTNSIAESRGQSAYDLVQSGSPVFNAGGYWDLDYGNMGFYNGNDNLITSNSFTICCRVYFNIIPSAVAQWIICHRSIGTGTVTSDWQLLRTGSSAGTPNKIVATLANNGVFYSNLSSLNNESTYNNKWNWIIIKYDNSINTFSLFINNETKQVQSSVTRVQDANSLLVPLSIGGYINASTLNTLSVSDNINIRQVGIWNRALSDEEISSINNSNKGIIWDSTLNYFKQPTDF